MHIRITCKIHDNCPVVPAGEELHWMCDNETDPGLYRLDFADLYCMGGTGDHEFLVNIMDDKGNWLAYAGG